jgi:hypothetical protein
MMKKSKKMGRPAKFLTEAERQEHYKEQRRKYNADKKTIQIPKDLHERIKSHCDENNLDIKDFIIGILEKNI